VVNTTNGLDHAAGGVRHRGRRLALTHTLLIVTRPSGVEFHLDHRVDATRGQHRVVGAEGLVAWLAEAGGSIAVRVVASCPCQGGGRSGIETPRTA
jgi:hypothetical protein